MLVSIAASLDEENKIIIIACIRIMDMHKNTILWFLIDIGEAGATGFTNIFNPDVTDMEP